ncbi:MAG TPA: VWA domain-containing protein [Candidatus Saccharimonadales bacterium]|nr:VWA domain-containing protein [Candidatus Saccharimonadales bacterium]
MASYAPDPRDLGDLPEPPRREPAVPRAALFSRWDGSQLVPDAGADEIMDALADDMMSEGDVAAALRRLMQRGWQSGDPTRPDMAGLQDLMERLRQRRRELLERYQLGDTLADIRAELESIVAEERDGVQRRLDEAAGGSRRDARPNGPPKPDDGSEQAGPSAQHDPRGSEDESSAPAGRPGGSTPASAPDPTPDSAALDDPQLRAMLRDMAARRLDQLDGLPAGVGDRIRGLQEYDFMVPSARQRFDDLVQRLQKQVLDQYMGGLSDAIKSISPEDMAANREMVRDLNRLLQERLAGSDPDASEFLSKHGQFFPGAQNLDDIIEQLAQRMAAMQSLLRSMSPEQRAELQSMMDALLRDDRLRWDLAQLAASLDQLLPGGLGERFRFSGQESLGLEGALQEVGNLQVLENLEAQLDGIGSPGDLADVDREQLGDLLGPDAVRDLEALDDLARRLEQAGYLDRRGDRLELTPRGSRRIGQKVLDDLFGRLRRDAFGGHRVNRTGRGGEREETTKPYEFGDPFLLDLNRTLGNALQREENAPGRRAGAGLRLSPADFEVYRTEETTRTATVLLVDMSRSMLLRGCFVAAKKVAIALNTLIRTEFPRDHLSVIGFAYYAREIRPEALAELSWHGYEYGTNLQHGLMLARRILAREHAANREIVVITDGEPTAHFENGQVEFSYPPTRRTIQETLREVVRCTKDGITINTFMLERSRALAEFVALVTRLNRGRAFYATPEHLGEYVLVDFVSRRTRKVS